ncbi:hypothetical protein LOD99_4430 [Oopsacas minuta]|uniref:protein disulfide-isomerase n=1 Tax=Oopsacas minuta TaxID=111878 RepID=A0AAV7JX45_9METZ|nr:hypothetical protein LOD99_4430 [Oopsacas minuta]
MHSLYYFTILYSCLSFTSALYTKSDDVIELTPTNFNQLVLGGEGMWFVEFYAPWCGHCKNLAPEWKKAAAALKGVVGVGAVDMDQYSSLGSPYGISGFPTIKIFGSNKNKPKDYQGARSAQAIVQAAMKEAADLVQERMGGGGGGQQQQQQQQNQGGQGKSDVIELSDETFDKMVLSSVEPWLVEFYAPWCGHCKNLAPHWAKAATELKGKINLGALDATTHKNTAGRYSVQGYPTIKFFPAGPKTTSSVEDYSGGRTADDIVQWGLSRWTDSVSTPEVRQLVGQDELDTCLAAPLCVITFLPHILDTGAEGRNKYLEMLTELGDKFKMRRWEWLWSEGGMISDLETALEVGGFGYPALVVVNSRKARYSLLRGAFSENGIDELLRGIAVGRGSTSALQSAGLPTVSEIQPWDGKDGEPFIEDDIDLSDFSWDDPVFEKEDL